MSTVLNRKDGFNREEPLPGYRTLDLLGRGGYGEVWRAIAPGGLHKAIKIVYGDAGPERTSSESRSLSRIKDLRHPMLLSIERIEMVESNLVIVTELADKSLKQEFDDIRKAGGVGVPQEELLRYVADAGEALDFLYQKCSLQHLDVKPENILLVSGRGKIGDFGLVKSLYQRSASLVGGLTPTYAPPEVFDGKPTRFSDQYSLAIVYMQMLTGVLPLSGGSMAEIATQHLKGVPDLSALPKRQRPVIARALSKDPQQRYESCDQMIRALRESLQEAVLPSNGSAAPQAQRGEEQLDLLQNAAQHGEPATPVRSPGTGKSKEPQSDTNAATSDETRSRSELSNPSDEAGPAENVKATVGGQPIILIAVGSTGVEVMSRLVARLRDRYGKSETWPNVQIVCLDTNAKTLSAPFCSDDLTRVHLLPIPLKSAENYGNQSREHLRWISRRWFYNIPRNLMTGGFRPLGRLALLTHAQRVRETLSRVVGLSLDAAGSLRQTPHIVVCGAINGGTGGGAMLDLNYAIRSELKRRGLPDDHTQALLLNAIPRANADRDKARANAFACLHELFHFGRPGSHYPAEPALGITPFHGDNLPFEQAQIFDLGSGLSEGDWQNASDQVAEFLYASTFTPARELLHLATENSATDQGDPQAVHPIEILSLGAGCSPLLLYSVQQAASDLTRLWRSGRDCTLNSHSSMSNCTVIMQAYAAEAAVRSAQFEPIVRDWLSAQRLQCDDLFRDSCEVIELEGNANWKQFVTHLAQEAIVSTQQEESGETRVEALLNIIDRYLHCDHRTRPEDLNQDPFYAPVVNRLLSRNRDRLEQFLNRLRILIDDPHIRIEGARQHALAARALVLELQQAVFTRSASIREKAMAAAITLRNPDSHRVERSRFNWSFRRQSPDNRLLELLSNYTDARLHELAMEAVAKVVRVMDTELSTLVEQMDRLARDLGLLVDEPSRAHLQSVDDADDRSLEEPVVISAYRQMLRQELAQRRQLLAEKVDEQLEQRLFKGSTGLQQYLQIHTDIRSVVQPHLQEIAHQEVLRLVEQINRELIEDQFKGTPVSGLRNIAQALAQAAQANKDAGTSLVGRLLMVPDLSDPTQLRNQLATLLPETVVVPGRKAAITLCSLHRPESLHQIAHRIIGWNEQYKELAHRLHTRIDLEWSPLVQSNHPSPTGTIVDSCDEWAHTALLTPNH